MGDICCGVHGVRVLGPSRNSGEKVWNGPHRDDDHWSPTGSCKEGQSIEAFRGQQQVYMYWYNLTNPFCCPSTLYVEVREAIQHTIHVVI